MNATKVITIAKGNNVGKTIQHELPKDAQEVAISIAYNPKTRIVTATVKYKLKHKSNKKNKDIKHT